MKKFIGITFIVCIIAFVTALVSFFLLDFPRGVRWGNEQVDEYDENYGIEKNFEDKVEDAVESFVYGILDRALDEEEYDEDMDWDEYDVDVDTYDVDSMKGMKEEFYKEFIGDDESGSEYITEGFIMRRNKLLLKKWSQSVKNTRMDEIKVELSNMNVVVGKTKSKKIEVYHVSQKKTKKNAKLRGEIGRDGTYYIEEKIGSRTSFNGESRNTLYLLLPDSYIGEVEVNLTNGNVITTNIENDVEIEVESGNVIANEPKADLSSSIVNGNIILSLGKSLNARVSLETENGVILGADKTMKGIRKGEFTTTFGHGRYEVDAEVENGNIIWGK